MYADLSWKEKLSYYSDLFWMFFDPMPTTSMVMNYYGTIVIPLTLYSDDETNSIKISFYFDYGCWTGVKFDATNKTDNYNFKVTYFFTEIEQLASINRKHLRWKGFEVNLLTPSNIDDDLCQWEWKISDEFNIPCSVIITNKERKQLIEYINLFHDVCFDDDPIEVCERLNVNYRDVINYYKNKLKIENERFKYEKNS